MAAYPNHEHCQVIPEVESGEELKTEIPNAKGTPKELQPLLKGDRVFTICSDEIGGTPSWTSIFPSKRELKNLPKFTSGTVILSKEWRHSNPYLSIKWGNGKSEKLFENSPSEYIAYGDRLFVLDRDCIGTGSKVFLSGYPEIEGTVKEKRYLATGRCTQDPGVIFEDIDISLLQRHTHGSTYQDIKILYQDSWLGVTSNFRTRLHLKPESSSVDVKAFCFVLNGSLCQKYNIGDEITLGFNLLNSGHLTGDDEIESTHWLLNAFRFLNVTATITDIEIDELHVQWIGKAGDTHTYPTSFHFPDSPPTTIPYHELKNVQYLLGAKHCEVTPKSIWNYRHDPNNGGGEDAPTSKEKWTSKWLQLVDWDRWVNPYTEDVSEKSRFWGRFLTLEIMYVRSVVDVIWQNGNEKTVNSGDVIPVHLESVWSDWSHFRKGSIVGDRMDNVNKRKYGVILQLDENDTATVNWVDPGNIPQNQDLTLMKSPRVPLYNLLQKPEYDFIWRVAHSPLVFPGDGNFKVGVVAGMTADTGQVRVKVSTDREMSFWPHQLSHYNCDVMMCPIQGCWTVWYNHIVIPSELSPATGYNGSHDVIPQETEHITSNKQLTQAGKVPTDNIFAHNNIPLNLLDTKYFRNAVEKELTEITANIQDGMWIEFYSSPGNVMSAVTVGPRDSLLEDLLFIFDIILLEDFPRSEPHINFRSMGVTILPGHFCKTGAVLLPEESRLADGELTSSEIVNLLLEVKGYMGVPLDLVYEMDKRDGKTLPWGKTNNSAELLRFVMMSVLDYTVALLQNPPPNWSVVVNSHYARVLPRIIKRFSQDQVELIKVAHSFNGERGDISNIEGGFEPVTHAWSKGFVDCIYERVEELKKILARLNS